MNKKKQDAMERLHEEYRRQMKEEKQDAKEDEMILLHTKFNNDAC